MPIQLAEHKPVQTGAQQLQRETPFRQQRKMVEENLKEVGKVIAIHSGKGGVGKTTIAVNLASALQMKGFKVGFLDADVDCPSSHKFFGAKERVLADNNQRLVPLEVHGIKFLSVGNMVESENEANIMRGPIMFKLISEMLYKANWGKLDYLIIDLPPGTGDNPLTIMQITPIYGMIIVTQPQEVAFVDAKKSANMAKRLGIPIIGLVENMSGEIFGKGKTEKIAEGLVTVFLGSVPLDKSFNDSSTKGVPAVKENKELVKIFDAIISEAAI